jgi:hypothetical protein
VIRRLLQPNMLRRSLAVSIGGGRIAVTGHSMRGGAAFSPLSLFAAGEQGAWYDPSDLSTMFQDDAGTIPVTAGGQPVGLLRDKSGNQSDLAIATASMRPLYNTDGTMHWLTFDGADDWLPSIASIDKTSWIGGMLVAGHLAILGHGGVSAGTANATIVNHEPYDDAQWYCAFGGSRADGLGSLTFNLRHVTARIRNATNTKFRIDAVPLLDAESPLDFGGDSIITLGTGAPMNDWRFFGNIYQCILLARDPTTQEITATEQWVANKAGVTLS